MGLSHSRPTHAYPPTVKAPVRASLFCALPHHVTIKECISVTVRTKRDGECEHIELNGVASAKSQLAVNAIVEKYAHWTSPEYGMLDFSDLAFSKVTVVLAPNKSVTIACRTVMISGNYDSVRLAIPYRDDDDDDYPIIFARDFSARFVDVAHWGQYCRMASFRDATVDSFNYEANDGGNIAFERCTFGRVDITCPVRARVDILNTRMTSACNVFCGSLQLTAHLLSAMRVDVVKVGDGVVTTEVQPCDDDHAPIMRVKTTSGSVRCASLPAVQNT